MDLSYRFIDTLSYKAITGRGNYGDPVFGALSTLKGFVEEHAGVIKRADGKESAYSHLFVTDLRVGIELVRGTHVWLPGGNTSDPDEALIVIATSKGTQLGGGYTIVQHMLGGFGSSGNR